MTRFLLAIKMFRTCEDGATTVDFVVLTAALIGLAVAVLQPVGGATKDYADASVECLEIIGSRTGRMNGTAANYNRMLASAERGCARVRSPVKTGTR